MGTTLNPYLNFRGNARDAMEFYKEVFGGTLTISTYADFHASTDASEDKLVMHADLEGSNGIRLMAADTPNRMEFQAGNNFSLSVSGESEAELRGYFDKLSSGGSVTMPLEKAAWGDTFGMCTDRFGTQWLVNVAAAKEAGVS
jgi:PhnB protein